MDSCQGKDKKVACIRCHGWKDTRLVPTEKGLDLRLKHYVCDKCEIGWYQGPGARSKPPAFTTDPMVPVNLETFKRFYVREGRPAKLPSRKH